MRRSCTDGVMHYSLQQEGIDFIYDMRKDIEKLIPQWAFTKQDRTLCLTNDLDSLLLANLLTDIFDYEINHFYSFRRFATANTNDKRKSIGCDLAINKGYTFCNHLTMLSSTSYKNPDSVNLNNVLNISNKDYSKKFNLSSLITAWSLYDIPLPKTEEGKMILLCIDSAYMGWRHAKYQYIMREWLEKLEMTELIDLLDKYSQSDFNDFKLSHELDTGIVLRKDGKLAFNPTGKNPYAFTGLDLDWISEHLGFKVFLPEQDFTVVGTFDTDNIGIRQLTKSVMENTFSMAFTFRDQISITTFKRGA